MRIYFGFAKFSSNFPQRMLLPAFRETHITDIHNLIFIKQIIEMLFELAARVDGLEKIENDAKEIVQL